MTQFWIFSADPAAEKYLPACDVAQVWRSLLNFPGAPWNDVLPVPLPQHTSSGIHVTCEFQGKEAGPTSMERLVPLASHWNSSPTTSAHCYFYRRLHFIGASTVCFGTPVWSPHYETVTLVQKDIAKPEHFPSENLDPPWLLVVQLGVPTYLMKAALSRIGCPWFRWCLLAQVFW